MYSKASVGGFDPALMSTTLDQLKKILRGRGNIPRPFEDYGTREFDISWRMAVLSGHIKEALSDHNQFNHVQMGKTSRSLGDIGHKDNEIIQKFFDKLNVMLDERDANQTKPVPDLDYEATVYGTFQGQRARTHVFEGFENNEEFNQHLTTLMEWNTTQKDGLAEMEIDADANIQELEMSMAKLI